MYVPQITAALRALKDSNSHVWRPSDNNLKAANFPPRSAGAGTGPPAGYYMFQRVKVPANVIITNVHVYIQAAGATLTYAAAGVYDSTGTQIGVTGSQTTTWNSAGHKLMALTTPIAASTTERFVWVALAQAGTTAANIAMASAITASNVNMIAPLVCGYIAGAAPLPASVTLANLITYYEYWIGLS